MKIKGLIYAENHTFTEGCVYIDGERISKTETDESLSSKVELKACDIDASGMYIIPGLTDVHLHGCMGVDFCDASIDSIEKISEYELKNGITQICLTSMSYNEEKLEGIFEEAGKYIENSERRNGAAVVGINMEGPFISMEKKASQNGKYIITPDIEMFKRLQDRSGNNIRLVDIAPEVLGAISFIKEVTKLNNTRVSLAHTMATYDEAMDAFKNGATHVTHLFNGMRAFNHRESGVIGAVSDYDKAYAELIGDGIHVSAEVVRMAFKFIGDERLVLISDSMEGTGLPDGEYSLGGQKVKKINGRAMLEDGKTLAGATSNLMDNVRNIVNNMGIPLESVIRCATENPARSIGIFDDYGSISKGKYANIVILDSDLNIKYVLKNGRIVKR